MSYKNDSFARYYKKKQRKNSKNVRRKLSRRRKKQKARIWSRTIMVAKFLRKLKTRAF